MEVFQLTVIRQNRVLLAILVFSLSLVGALFLFMALDSLVLKVVVPLFVFILLNFVAVYNSFSVLLVKSVDKKLIFTWKKKLLFNFAPIEEIQLSDVDTLVIDYNIADNMEFLQKILTNKKTVSLGISKYWRKDADEFIVYLKNNTSARVIDSWDVWKEKGFLGIAYYLTLMMLVAGAGLISWIILSKGIKNLELEKVLYFFSSYAVLISYFLIMKSKLKKNRR